MVLTSNKTIRKHHINKKSIRNDLQQLLFKLEEI